MNVAQHISQLLYRYQCVTIPGFGAFLTETVSANIQENNHTFFPPKKVISFNANIKNNDGLLANHVAVAERISYEHAVSAIENEVSEWKTKLEGRDYLIFKGIGLLKLNAEGNIVFEASSHVNYLTDSFGLSSYVSPAIKREALKNLADAPATKKISIETIEERKTVRPYLKYAAMFVLSLGGTGFGYVSYINQQEQAETLLVQKQVQNEVKNKIQEATFFLNNPIGENTVDPNLNYNFHIVSGSFRIKKYAENAMNILIQKGYDASVLERNEDGLFSVLYGTYNSQAEADAALLKIQNQENKDAWILLQEK
ncbi:HU domain-containing protein [Flavobacterium luminosum]|uniref:SPOR domain-containing protein n=1 Tax=Flavobacterium luminosum TaxID=2949086 RepID=A0ABT0TRB1_9FLAO|nr:SPOR domain-containing protein [Flavobacterium sp. HXWNR70]MCL9809895.1 SPOR domain-containing protein [Flavobacterium sp. HXWNR70]